MPSPIRRASIACGTRSSSSREQDGLWFRRTPQDRCAGRDRQRWQRVLSKDAFDEHSIKPGKVGWMIEELKKRYHRNLFDSVIPFWEHYSLDREYGGQMHCLTREGKIFDTRKYVWMQGRAAWMFSKLYNDVEQRPEWLD